MPQTLNLIRNYIISNSFTFCSFFVIIHTLCNRCLSNIYYAPSRLSRTNTTFITHIEKRVKNLLPITESDNNKYTKVCIYKIEHLLGHYGSPHICYILKGLGAGFWNMILREQRREDGKLRIQEM